MKYPVGIQTFELIIRGGYVYVDKTDLVYKLVKEGKVYFLSRPRRFGKSMLVSTLEQYFLGHKELFKGLAIDSLETEWLEYPVFHVDFNSVNFTVARNLEDKIDGYLNKWEKDLEIIPRWKSFGDRFYDVLEKAHSRTGRKCVVLIDEYDKPLLDVFDSGYTTEIAGQKRLLEDWHRDVLKGFYSTLKAADAHLQFVLLTGVTKFSQVSVFSGLNQLVDISMIPDFDTLCGITNEELDRYFTESIAELAKKLKVSPKEAREKLRDMYDGYHFSEELVDIYNPFSILNALQYKRISNYWFTTGTPTYLMRLLAHAKTTINELVGKSYKPDAFADYKATVEKPLPMIYQSGYLTIKKHNPRSGTYTLDFPNNEVKDGFLSALMSEYFASRPAMGVGSWLDTVLDALDNGQPDDLRTPFTALFASIPYSVRRNNGEPEYERYFQYTFYLILRLISVYEVFIEKQTSEGRIDCVVETPDFIYIFEFKLDGSAQAALQQIEERGYATQYAADKRKLFKIGVNFSSKTGTIDEWETIK